MMHVKYVNRHVYRVVLGRTRTRARARVRARVRVRARARVS